MDRLVSCASFLTKDELDFNVAHHRAVATLSLQHKNKCNPMHLLYTALPVPYVPCSAGYTQCFGRSSVYSRCIKAGGCHNIVVC